jgi:hypothetical protein
MPVSSENPTAALRFVERAIAAPIPGTDHAKLHTVRILQQRWDIYEDGLPAVTRSEWRDIPLEAEYPHGYVQLGPENARG